MNETNTKTWLILAAAFVLGTWLLGSQIAKGITDFKKLDRSVTVKGLSEKEFPADIVIWPLQYVVSSNDINDLYQQLENNQAKTHAFLYQQGISAEEVSLSSPEITDKSIHQYDGQNQPRFRFTATQTMTVYSKKIDLVRSIMNKVADLGKQGVLLQNNSYEMSTQYLFTRLNEIKPAMIEEATNKAREVAKKFAKDSKSKLGKIKKARQGQFSIYQRDNNNPHIKKVRVVSTVEYYLTD